MEECVYFMPKMRKRCLSIGIAMLFLSLPRILTAADSDQNTQAASREMEAQRQATTAAEKADEKEYEDSFKHITFDNILQNPDDIDLNLKFALEEIAKGNVLGAVSALERILLINPKLARVRLLYAVALFRLDNMSEAEFQFHKLMALDPPPPDDAKKEIEGYLKQIAARRRRNHVLLRQSNAFQIDDNRNAGPSSKQRLFADVRLDVEPPQAPRKDTSFLNITHAELSRDLGFQAAHEVYAAFDYYRAEQTNQIALDLQAFQTEMGFKFKNYILNVTPSFLFNHTTLSQATYFRSQGWGLAIDHEFKKKLTVFAEGRIERQDFSDIEENLTAHEKTGNELDGSFGVRYRILPPMSLSIAYRALDKHASRKYNAYTGQGISFGHNWLLGKGQFLLTSLDLDRDRYASPEYAISTRNRRDGTLRTRVTYGLPLEVIGIGKVIPPPFKGMLLTVTYEFFRSLSNVTNYTYTNNKYQLMLTKSWEF